MNLVAKEYVAAQDADDPGVLILSRFAGAAVECKPALLVNPYDTEAVAAAIQRALTMPLEERRARHSALYDIILKSDINDWPGRFLSALTGAPTLEAPPDKAPVPTSAEVTHLADRRAAYRTK
jgi:trehalose 6-phosphate synthase